MAKRLKSELFLQDSATLFCLPLDSYVENFPLVFKKTMVVCIYSLLLETSSGLILVLAHRILPAFIIKGLIFELLQKS